MSKSLDDLLPIVKQKAEEFLAKCKEAGIDVAITSTYRSVDEQNALYAQGRTTDGHVITNAKGGQSIHNYRCAMDFCPMTNNTLNWNDKSLFTKVGEIGESVGLEWGGRWASFLDLPHLQYTLGHTWQEFEKGSVDLNEFNLPIPEPIVVTIPESPVPTAMETSIVPTGNGTPVKDAINWVVSSSQDPTKVSMTVKGLLVALVPKAVVLGGLLQLPVSSDNLNNIIEQATQGLQGALMLVGALLFAWGVVRKLHDQFLAPKVDSKVV